MILGDVFKDAGDCRVYETFSRLAEPVSAVIRGGGVATDVHVAVEALFEGSRHNDSLLERGASPGRSLPVFAAEHLVARLTPVSAAVAGRAAFGTLAEHTLLAVVSGGPVHVVRFSLPDPRTEPFDGPLRIAAQHRLVAGDVLTFDALHETFEVGDVDADAVLLTAVGERVAQTLRSYDPDDLTYQRSTASSMQESRLRFALLAFSAFPPNERSVDAVCTMLDHPAHHVRWSAVEALATIAPARGYTALRAALDDPHPHVRNAARRTLERMHVADPAV